MQLGDGTGLEVLAAIAERNLDLPCAVITAFGNADNAVAALKAGAFDYLAKPVSLDQLRTLVKSAIKMPAERRATPAGAAGSLPSNAPALVGESPTIESLRSQLGPANP